MPTTSANLSSEWKLDKILPASRWPLRLGVTGAGLALLAILACGLTWQWQVGLVVVLALLVLINRRTQQQVRALSISDKHCTLRLSNHKIYEFTPPYRATPLVWWVSLHYQDGFAGRWLWLYRDQFSDDEWRQLLVLLRWSS